MKRVMLKYAEQNATRELFRIIKSEVKSGYIKETDDVELNISVVNEFAQYYEEGQTQSELDFDKIRQEMLKTRPIIKTKPYRIVVEKTNSLVDFSLEQFIKKLYQLDYNQLVKLENFLVFMTTKINMKINKLRILYNEHVNDFEIAKLEGECQTLIDSRISFLEKEFTQLKILEAYRDAYVNMQVETVIRKGQFNEHPTNSASTQIY